MRTNDILLSGVVAIMMLSSLGLAETETRKFDRKTQDNNVLFVIDHSGSVAGSTLESYKAAIAVETSRNKERRFGLIDFPSDGVCGVAYPVKLGHNTGDEVASTVGGLNGSGGSPIAAGLQKGREVMEAEGECVKLVVFTDYEDTCSGDIKGVMAGVDAYCMEINLISHRSELDLGILGELAKKSGGKIHQVNGTRDSIRRALEDVLKKKRGKGSFTTFEVPVEKPKETTKPKEKPKEQEKPREYQYQQGTGDEKGRGSK